MPTVYAMEWVEKERGWGQRPDGHSLHASEASCAAYVAAYWARQPKEVPHEYDAPASDRPKPVEVGEALAAWVAERDRRLWKGDLALKGGKATVADPKINAEAERCLLARCAQAARSHPKPTL